jgi:hypothetical protein
LFPRVDRSRSHPRVSSSHATPHSQLRSDFFATEPRLLRAAVAAFLDLLNLSTRTIEQFGHVPAQAA